MKTLFWSNSSQSGLCDRLIDLSLMITFSRILAAKLFLEWKTINTSGTYLTKSLDSKKYHDNRYHDYLYENLCKYFILPADIEVFTEQKGIKDTNFDYVFVDYLGGVYSAATFWEKYAKNICNIEFFIKKYNEVLEDFKPSENLLRITNNIDRPDLSIHLRRTDKVVINPDHFATNNLELLNKRTTESIENFINKNGPETKIYFSSDDEEEKLFFENKYQKYLVKKSYENFGYINTYVDMFLLFKSKVIILSQKHSSFSIFCSLIGGGELIYLFEDCPLVEMKYPLFKNFKLYSDTNYE
jgi:hypothetical protein